MFIHCTLSLHCGLYCYCSMYVSVKRELCHILLCHRSQNNVFRFIVCFSGGCLGSCLINLLLSLTHFGLVWFCVSCFLTLKSYKHGCFLPSSLPITSTSFVCVCLLMWANDHVSGCQIFQEMCFKHVNANIVLRKTVPKQVLLF